MSFLVGDKVVIGSPDVAAYLANVAADFEHRAVLVARHGRAWAAQVVKTATACPHPATE